MKRSILFAAAVATAFSTSSYAQENLEMAVDARQGIMAILGMNMGVLGGMARGRMDYDADKAQSAANAILGVSMVDMGPLLLEGTDSISMDGNRADPAIWDDLAGYTAEWAKVQMAAPALAEAAGQGKDAMSAALGGVGGTCRSCHMSYRSPEF